MSTIRLSDLDFAGVIYEFEDILAQNRLDHLTYPNLTTMEEDASLEVNDSAVVNGGIFNVHEVVDVENEEDMTDPETIYYYNGSHYYGNDGGEAIGFETVNGFAVLSDKNIFATPEQFGAIGDGVTDDTTAITYAIKTGYPVLFKKRYKMSSNLVVPAGAVLLGDSDKTGGGTEILFAEGFGLEIAGRNATVKNMTFTQTVSGTGSGLKFTNDGYKITADNLIVNNFNIGLDRRVTLWNSKISNSRFNYCNTLYDSSNATTGTMTFTMFNVHANRCTQIFSCRAGDKFSCISCNFGIIQYPAFAIETVSAIDFNNCNFECDERVETGANMFSVGTRGLRFEHCLFKVNSHADGHVFALFNPSYLEFKNCVYESITGNEMPESNFFNLNYFTTSVYGAVRFNGGNASMPRPSTTLTTARWPNWIDVERGKPIVFYQTNILKDKLYTGEILYSYTNKALCVYDGTNVVNVRTGDIVL